MEEAIRDEDDTMCGCFRAECNGKGPRQSSSFGIFSGDPFTSGASKLSRLTVTVFRKVDTDEPTPIGNIFVSTQSTHTQIHATAFVVCFFDIRPGSVGFRTELVETITEEVGPEREWNPRPPARDSLNHG